MNSYRDLIYDSKLYPEEVVKQYGELSVHWSRESWIKREKSLRHDMCCLLLANLTQEDNEEDLREIEGADGVPIKYRVIEKPDGEIHLQESYPRVLPSNKKRYMILEGSTVAGLTQNVLAREWGLSSMPLGTWDLVDQCARKFVEIKITTDMDKAINDFDKKVESDKEHYSLVWFHPTSLNKLFLGCTESDFTGVSKVVDFLGHRNILLNEAGILVSDSNETEDLEETIFVSPGLTSLVELWKGKWLNMEAPRMSDEEIQNAPIPEAHVVEISQLKACLEDPSKRDAEVVKYNGKLLPESMVHHMLTSEDKDFEMVVELITTWNDEILPRNEGTQACHLFEEILRMLETKNFETHDYPKLRKVLGVGAKERTYRATDNTTRIPDKIPPKNLKYHPWMHTMIRDMTVLDPDFEGVAFPELLEEEEKTNHPMEAIARSVSHEVTEIFCKGLVGHWCQKVKNLYSRIGGIYSNKGDNVMGHNYMAIFPIYSKVFTSLNEGSEKYQRKLSGVIIRAPDHTRQGSDKINILSIEMTKPDGRTRKYHPYIKNFEILRGSEYDLVIRQNALMKLDSSYLTFSNNSLFNVTNFIGEMILFEESMKQFADPVREGKKFCTKYTLWIKERLAECTFMMLLGGSQEEGLLAMHRMLFMILLNMERGRECFIYNVEGFCKKTNECVIDRPLAMYFQKCMYDAVCILNQR